MPTYVLTLLATGPPDEVEAATQGHHDLLRELRARGQLRAAGEFTQGDGFLQIFDAADRLQAEALVQASPLVADGLVTWMLREWKEWGPLG